MGAKIGQASSDSFSRSRDLHPTNYLATKSALDKTAAIKDLTLDNTRPNTIGHSAVPRWQRESDWSHATTFGRGGIQPGQGIKDWYVRDPHTGVWHKDRHNDRLGRSKSLSG